MKVSGTFGMNTTDTDLECKYHGPSQQFRRERAPCGNEVRCGREEVGHHLLQSRRATPSVIARSLLPMTYFCRQSWRFRTKGHRRNRSDPQ